MVARWRNAGACSGSVWWRRSHVDPASVDGVVVASELWSGVGRHQ